MKFLKIEYEYIMAHILATFNKMAVNTIKKVMPKSGCMIIKAQIITKEIIRTIR